MEPTEQLLKELLNLQAAYKTGFDLLSQRVDNQAKLLENSVADLREAKGQMDQLMELLKEVIGEKDVQVQRLLKSVAAIVRVTEQLIERFQIQE